jgi:hypothetical protein
MEPGDIIPEESSTDTLEVPKKPKRSSKKKSFKKAPAEKAPKKKGKSKVPAKRKPKKKKAEEAPAEKAPKKKGQKSVAVKDLETEKVKRIRKTKKAAKERIAWSKLKKADLIRMAEEKELQIEYKKLTVLQLKQALGYVKRQLTDKQRAGIEKAKRTRAAKKAAGK